MQRRPRLGRTQVGSEDPLDAVQPLVEGRPGQVGVLGRFRLVTAGGQVGAQYADEVSVMFAGEQGTEFALHEGLQPRVVAEQMEQATQPQIRQPVEQRPAGPRQRFPGPRQRAFATAGIRALGRHVGDLASRNERRTSLIDPAVAPTPITSPS